MKKTLFFKNAKLLAQKFNIVPLLYGSLGLEYITKKSLGADDIDILIPEIFLADHWFELKSFLTDEGYVLVDEHEHTFCKDGIFYSYASVEELETFAGIRLSEISQQIQDDISFRLLSLEQYLKVYKTSVKDGYRINTRKKKDNEKIAFIEKCLEENPA